LFFFSFKNARHVKKRVRKERKKEKMFNYKKQTSRLQIQHSNARIILAIDDCVYVCVF